MAMAAAWMGRRKIIPTLAITIMRRREATRTVVFSTQKQFVNHCINGQHVRRSAAAAECFIPQNRRYGTCLFSSTDMKKLSRLTGEYNYDFAVDKAIQHYHNHIKMEGQNIMIYPVRGVSECLCGVEMFHILLETTEGQKYVSIYVAPLHYDLKELDDGALKLVFFRKVDCNFSLPFDYVVGAYKWPVSPRNDPLVTVAARFALAQHNKEEKLAYLVRANSQMVWEHEIFRMIY